MTDRDKVRKLQQGIRTAIVKLSDVPGVNPADWPDDPEHDDPKTAKAIAAAKAGVKRNTGPSPAEIDRRYAQARAAGFKPDREFFVKAVIKGDKS